MQRKAQCLLITLKYFSNHSTIMKKNILTILSFLIKEFEDYRQLRDATRERDCLHKGEHTN